jgi:hypothetical protein
MTLKEAVLFMRRYEDWNLGQDLRRLTLALPDQERRSEAMEVILAHHGLSGPLTQCRACVHHDKSTVACSKDIVGCCSTFQRR